MGATRLNARNATLTFSPPCCWVSRRTQSYSCPTRPAQAKLTNNAQYQTSRDRPQTVSRGLSSVLSQVRSMSAETWFTSFCHRYVACQQVRCTTAKYAHHQLLVLSAGTRHSHTHEQTPNNFLCESALNENGLNIKCLVSCTPLANRTFGRQIGKQSIPLQS